MSPSHEISDRYLHPANWCQVICVVQYYSLFPHRLSPLKMLAFPSCQRIMRLPRRVGVIVQLAALIRAYFAHSWRVALHLIENRWCVCRGCSKTKRRSSKLRGYPQQRHLGPSNAHSALQSCRARASCTTFQVACNLEAIRGSISCKFSPSLLMLWEKNSMINFRRY